MNLKYLFVLPVMNADAFRRESDEAARTILRAGRNRFWNTRYVPLRWWLVGAAIRAIPSFLFRRLNV